jgi:capsular exopolysaccharide synthesis family protein
VWRFKYVVIVVVVAAAAVTYVISNRQAKVYKTATRLYVGPSPLQNAITPGSGGPSDRSLADEASLITTLTIADQVKANLDFPGPAAALLGIVQATPSAGSDFITLTGQGGNPHLIAAVTNGFAQAFLQVQRANLVSSAQLALASAKRQLAAERRGLAPNTPLTASEITLQQQIGNLQTIIDSPPSRGQQLSPALAPGVPASPRPKRDAIFAAVVALVLCIIGAYLYDRSDRRVRRLDDLEALFDLPVLATLPHVRRSELAKSEIPTSLREQYRALRVNLDMARRERADKVIMVTSALPSEGKSTVVRNLGLSYRDAGARVAIIEADLRKPVLAAQFGVSAGPGLSEMLADGGELPIIRTSNDAAPNNGHSGELDLTVAGAAPYDPTALLTEGRLRGVISNLADKYDIVLIDSPPLLSVSDGLPLLGVVDGVLLVVRGGTMTRSAADRLRRTIERVGATRKVDLLGVVANDVADDLASYYRRDGGRQGVSAASPAPVAAPADS